MSISAPQEFPAYALPQVVRDAVWEAQRNTQAPLGLIASSALTAMSLAMQGLANVERMNGLEAPLSLWLLTLAESGERKTAVDSKFLGVIREFETEQAQRFAVELRAYMASMSTWRVKQKVILNAIKQSEERDIELAEFSETATLTDDTEGKTSNDLRARLDAHYATKPNKPRRVKLIYNNATPSAIIRSLMDNWPSIGLVSDEGAGIFNGRMVSDLSLPNSMWGGAPVHFERVDACIVVPDPRLTFSVQIQPGPLRRYLERKGEEAHDTGFSARFLICYPPSTQGGRFIQNPAQSWEHLPIFNARIRDLLEMNVRPDGEPVKKMTLTFSPEAQDRWIIVSNTIESELNPGRYYCGVKGYAAKIADNLARMAGLFHLFQGGKGPIPLETLEQAVTVMMWYTEEFVRLFSPPTPVPQDQIDAAQLEIYFAQQVMRTNGLSNIKRSHVLQYGPNPLRVKARLSVVLDVLYASGKISLMQVGKTCWIILNPAYFTLQQVQFLCAKGAMNR